MNDFVRLYANLVANYVDPADAEQFHDDFAEVLNAYQNDDDDEAISHVVPFDKLAKKLKETVDDIVSGKTFELPQVGEVYKTGDCPANVLRCLITNVDEGDDDDDEPIISAAVAGTNGFFKLRAFTLTEFTLMNWKKEV